MRYEPHDYQKYAIDYIESHPFAAVLLDMGLGKTSITLTAIADLLFDSFMVHKVLVIAPLRVARDTWPAEIGKWDHLSHLTFSVAVGTEAERKAALEAKADIYIINRENVQCDRRAVFLQKPSVKALQGSDAGAASDQPRGRPDRHSRQQRPDGPLGRIQGHRSGQTPRSTATSLYPVRRKPSTGRSRISRFP